MHSNRNSRAADHAPQPGRTAPQFAILNSQFSILNGATFAICLITLITAFAADKSGVSPNSISIPTGPGSIEGLGESFQPTLNTGTAKSGVALKLPPGVAGHSPDLALGYDAGGGN